MQKKKLMESKIKKITKKILDKELYSIGQGTGSLCFYQPKEPAGLIKYKNVK